MDIFCTSNTVLMMTRMKPANMLASKAMLNLLYKYRRLKLRC